MEEFISKFHKDEICNALSSKNRVITINFDLTNLIKENKKLFNQLKHHFDDEQAKWKKAVINQITKLVQTENIQLPNQKMEIEFEFFNHPERIEWPQISTDLFQLVEFKGYVFRSSTPRKLELLREVMCLKCRQTTMIKADRQYDYAFQCSRKCIMKEGCDGKMVYTKKQEEIPPLENTIDFQVFKVQELDKFTPKNRYYAVEVEGKLVDSCSIGDTVYILGTFETRNDAQTKEVKRVVIRALNISKAFEFKHSINSDEKEATFAAWIADKKRNNDNELEARDEMVKAVAPELSNCFILKLALLVVLCTGGRAKQYKTRTQRVERMTNRDISHLLFIGLPGLGKSQLIKAASKISSRAVKCVGSACSLAGLTASSYREDKETHVEAGALVLANHGICCIDEFNLLSTRNRGALHDAMEHQKFSFMQANLKVEINTRCNVIASMNHKAEQTAESRNKNIKNAAFNIEPSLISRFDFVFFLEKPEDPEFDLNIIESIISESTSEYKEIVTEWSLERLQLHIIGAKNLACELTPNVLKLIFNYYRFCNACEEVDESRKTMRLLKSLERLTIGHAKLMLRTKAKLIDGLTVIWLMENSWNFGDLVTPTNVILSELPLGPSRKCIQHIFDTLHLSELNEVFDQEQKEIQNETINAMEFNTSIQEEVGNKKELKKLFNKTGAYKRRSNETKVPEKPIVDEDIPEVLRQSFAINRIDDLFTNSDEETTESSNAQDAFQESPKVQNIGSMEDMLSLQDMENYFLNELGDDDSDDVISGFVINKENMSTQRNQPSTSRFNDKPSTSQFNDQPSTSSNLLQDDHNINNDSVNALQQLANIMQKSGSSKSTESEPKRLKPSIDDTLEDLLEPSNNSVFKKHDGGTLKNKPSTLGFLGRLKTFEYSSQQSQKSGPSNQAKGNTSTAISENLLALTSQLASKGNQERNTSGNQQQNVSGNQERNVRGNQSMTREEYLKALDDELDLWN